MDTLKEFAPGTWVYGNWVLEIVENGAYSSDAKCIGHGSWSVNNDKLVLHNCSMDDLDISFRNYYEMRWTWMNNGTEHTATFLRKTKLQISTEKIIGTWRIIDSAKSGKPQYLKICSDHKYHSTIPTFSNGTWRLIYTNVIELRLYDGTISSWTIFYNENGEMKLESTNHVYKFYKVCSFVHNN